MPSVTCLLLSDVSVIYRVTNFQFPIQSAFLPYIGRQAEPALLHTIGFNTQYKVRTYSERCRKFGYVRYVSCTERIHPRGKTLN